MYIMCVDFHLSILKSITIAGAPITFLVVVKVSLVLKDFFTTSIIIITTKFTKKKTGFQRLNASFASTDFPPRRYHDHLALFVGQQDPELPVLDHYPADQ